MFNLSVTYEAKRCAYFNKLIVLPVTSVQDEKPVCTINFKNDPSRLWDFFCNAKPLAAEVVKLKLIGVGKLERSEMRLKMKTEEYVQAQTNLRSSLCDAVYICTLSASPTSFYAMSTSKQ